MTRTTVPALEWREDATGVERAALGKDSATVTLVRTPGGLWWHVYWPPSARRKLKRGARSGNDADRESALHAAMAAFHRGRP